MDLSVLTEIVKNIIAEQRQIIGPLAIDQANKVSGIKVSSDLASINIDGDAGQILTELVGQYEKLFGKASVEACKESIKGLLPKISVKELPEFLR